VSQKESRRDQIAAEEVTMKKFNVIFCSQVNYEIEVDAETEADVRKKFEVSYCEMPDIEMPSIDEGEEVFSGLIEVTEIKEE